MTETGSSPQQTARIFRDWSEISFVEVGLALGAAAVAVVSVQFLVPRIASILPDRFRFYVLPWEPVLRLLIMAAAFFYIAPIFVEPTRENLLAIGGTTAVALGFAFKDYASSLIAGVVALYERPYRAGDWVRIGDAYGEVQSLGLRTVTLLTPDDTVVAIPHLKIWDSSVHNDNSGRRDLMCVADFYLHPDHDGERVSEALRDVALTSPYVHLDRPVRVVAAEEPWATHYRLKAYPIEGRDQFQFVTDLTLRGKAALGRLDVRAATATAAASSEKT